MKKLLILILVFIITGCNKHEKEKKQMGSDKKNTHAVKPNEKWDVYKKYDKFGNLIKYDSIYSWSYSNIKGDSIRVNLDSIMESFKGYFHENLPFKWPGDFSYFPKKDSLLKNDFFKDDYFFRNWQREQSELEEMVKKMDSSRNSFLKHYKPGLMESKKKIRN